MHGVPPALPSLQSHAHETVLTNGLRVIVEEDETTASVAVAVTYHAGAKEDPAGKSGLAHLVEHVAFDGTAHAPGRDDFARLLEDAGAREYNGLTSHDVTTFMEVVPANQLALALWLESERMGYLVDPTPEETLASEKQIVLQERREREDATEIAKLAAVLDGELFPEGHPYHRGPIGLGAETAAATAQDVDDFHRHFYVPRNACLAIVGNVRTAAALELAQTHFGALASPPPPNLAWAAPPVRAERRVTVEADVDRPLLIAAWTTPPPTDAEEAAIAVALRDVHGQLASRVFYGDAHPYAFESGVSFQRRELAGVAALSIALRAGADPRTVVERLDYVTSADRVAQAPEYRTRFDTRRAAAGLLFAEEGVEDRAMDLAEWQLRVGDAAFERALMDRYRALTPDAVNAAKVKYLGRSGRLLVLVRPTPNAPRGGRVVPGGAW